MTDSTAPARRTTWSPAEDDALLRAWADVVEWRASSLAKAFAAVCAATSIPQERTTNSVKLRLGLHQRMFKIARAFNERHQQQASTPDNEDGGADGVQDRAQKNSSTTKYSSDSWFKLRDDEQRRWFASLSTGTYKFSEMSREMFDRIAVVFERKRSNDTERRVSPQTQPRRERTTVKKDPLSTTDLRASIARLRDASTVQQHSIVSKSPDEETTGSNEKSVGRDENDSSCTESDEEVSMWWEDSDEIVPRSPVNSAKANPEPKIKMDGMRIPEQMGSVDPDFLELVSSLETQARHLGGLFHQTKRRRQEESRERQYIWKKIQIDLTERDRVLKETAHRDDELQRGRDEWEEERRNMKQALVQLRERRAVASSSQSPTRTSRVCEEQ